MARKKLIAVIIVCAVILAGCVFTAVYLEVNASHGGDTVTTAPTQTEPTVEPTVEPTTEPTQPTETQPTQPTETEPEPTEPQPEVFTLTFVGDCTLGSMPSWFGYASAFVNVVGDNYELPFQYVRSYFENDDCTFVNLESVLADSGTPADKQFTFRGPTRFVNILTCSSVEMVTLSNNHTYDFGTEGYLTTKETLEGAGVSYVEKNSATLYTTESGLTIGVYGLYFSLNEADMVSDIAWLKDNGAEIIVAAIHWGSEGVYYASAGQINIAHKLIDAGVDIVWGHHPHVLQKIEEYNGGIVYYSLGNFSFGGNHNPSDKDTAVLQQQVIREPDGTVHLGELTIIPCCLSSVTNKNDFQPTPCEEGSARYESVLSKLLGTYDGPNLDMSYRNPSSSKDNDSSTDTTEPDETTPDETVPDETTPDETFPDETTPGVTEPDTTEPDTTEPDTTEPAPTEPAPTEPAPTEPAPEPDPEPTPEPEPTPTESQSQEGQ